MPIRPIIRYPDPRLTLRAQPVTVFDGALRDLARDLLETMHAAPGIGITAPHIGISLRVVVLDLDPIDGARTYVNPDIIWASPEMIMHQEGSVSMPGVNDDVKRHARVRISYRDITATCRPRNQKARARSVTSMRSISSMACSGSSGCRA
jgi:peptide deformylase